MWFFTTKSKTQKERIIDMLIKRDRKPYEFSRVGILSHTKIISELRKDGYVIKCTKEYVKSGKKTELHTIYSLLGQLDIYTTSFKNSHII